MKTLTSVFRAALIGVALSHAGHADESPFRSLEWTTTGPLISPVPDAEHSAVAVKDPTIVRHGGKWHLFSTTVDTKGAWGMEYRSFKSWKEASQTQPFYFDQLPIFAGYHCAPQVFYFRPQRKWYLIFQSPQPTFSTNDDIDRPEGWSAPQSFFDAQPASVVEGWLDFWIICDDTHAYLFFPDDHGRFYRSRTTIDEFPKGFSEPVVVMQEDRAADMFEAVCVYRLKGSDDYLCIIECMGEHGVRYFRGFKTDRLDGEWTPMPEGGSWEKPFAGPKNVTAVDGGEPWTSGISHGELIRETNDECMIVDPRNMLFLYQGVAQGTQTEDYSQLPYRLALLRSKDGK